MLFRAARASRRCYSHPPPPGRRPAAALPAPAPAASLRLLPRALASNGCWQRPHSTATADEQPLFSQLELRVGQIVKVWEHPTADRLWCEEIDVGEDAPRQIASGLRQVYTEEEMLGQRLVVVCNLKKRKLMGFPSHGMVLCAMSPPEEEGGAPAAIEFVVPPDSASLGDRVVIAAAVTDEATGEMAPPVSAAQVKKRKVWEQIQPLLSTDEEGVARFDGDPMECSAGAVLTAPTIRNGIVS